ncbi:retron St85 family effector protein [Marinococcus halotolerans]|uniref:retron St85 family effector protein n=1 Tax=Marinococcus halotolerans TaxID=301092 RepID=UPI0003B48E92|nr:retron St85 family effector protein [Marinococcus halotolerans]
MALDMNTKNTLLKIHNEVFSKINKTYVDVFLCGAASDSKFGSLRDGIRDAMKDYKYVRFLYPEDLFIDMLNMNKEHNLLTLEKFLAENSDLICIVCESPGSLVELGAFTNNDQTFDKVIAVIEEKRKKDKSFIMLGPVKLLEKRRKDKVIYYNENDLEKLYNHLLKAFRHSKKSDFTEKKVPKNNSVNTMMGLNNFIPLLLYFFKDMSVDQLTDYIKYVYMELGHSLHDFDTVFNSGLKLLYKEKHLNKYVKDNKSDDLNNKDSKESFYSLTESGFNSTNSLLKNLNISNRTRFYDRIRFEIMENKFYT